MRIAVLFFGQPRFFDVTAPFIRKYLHQKSHELGRQHPVATSDTSYVTTQIDFFAHFWNMVGYSPKSPEEKINTDKVINILEEQFSVKRYRIDNFEKDLYGFHKIMNGLFNNTVGYDSQLENKAKYSGLKGRYGTGQYYSFGEVFNLMEEYEIKNKFKYDIVLRLRTDYLINKVDLDTLFDFKSFYTPIMKGCAPKSRQTIIVKKNKTLNKLNLSNYKLEDGAFHDRPGYGTYRGDIRVRDHLWCYNRSGAEVFIRNFWKYYFLTYIHDTLNIFLPAKFLDEQYTMVSENRYWSCETLNIIISGLTGATVELLPYLVIRVNHDTTKNKYLEDKNSIPLLQYKSFNNDNTAFLDIIDKKLNNFLVKKDKNNLSYLSYNE